MSAIDLLLTAGQNSERLHQLVLEILLERTPLLARLTGHAFAVKRVRWDPEGRAFDLLVEGEGGEELRIEVAVDRELSRAHLREQAAANAARRGLDLVYLLLGTSEIAHGERWGEWPQILGAQPRPRLYGGGELREAVLAAVDDHTAPDVREVAHAYARRLAALAERTRGHAGKSLAEFTADDFLGFLDELRAVEGLGGGSSVARVDATGRSFVACAWAGADSPVWSLYMQLECAGPGDTELCLKLHVKNKHLDARRRLNIRERGEKAIARTAKQAGLAVELTPERGGRHTTIARFTGVEIRSADPRDEALRRQLREVHALVLRTGEALRASDGPG